MSTNVVVVSGRLTKNPELRSTKTGKSVCNFDIAHNLTKDLAFFESVTVWGTHAEACADRLRKGSFVTVTGKRDINKWTDRETGEKREKVFINFANVDFEFEPQEKREPGHRAYSTDAPEEDCPF